MRREINRGDISSQQRKNRCPVSSPAVHENKKKSSVNITAQKAQPHMNNHIRNKKRKEKIFSATRRATQLLKR
jgi:hypothetical protein